jgi:hypothetical protein
MKTSHFYFAALQLGLHLTPAAAAPEAQNVTVVPLSTSCYDWPNWQNVRGQDITGAFTFVSDQTGDEGSDNLRVRSREYADANNEKHQVLVVDVRKSGLISSRITAYCVDGIVRFGRGLDEAPIVIDNTGVMQPEGTGFKLEPYAHEINGVRQPGVFLGTKNLTTWGYDYIRPADCSLDFYFIWLEGVIPDESNGRSPMLRGFIKADGL